MTSGSFTANFVEPDPDQLYRLTLTVTDSQGATFTTTRDILPVTVQLNLGSNPAGVSLTIDGQPVTGTVSSVVGSVRSISAPPTAVIGGTTYNFVSWSDGGAVTHDLTTPASNATFTANYALPNTAPTVATPAAAAPNPSAGVQSQLSVLGADSGGEANLTYTWTTLSQPAGSPNPTFSANGVNSAKNTTVTVSAAGNYVFRATISDSSLTTTSDAALTVNFTLGQRSPIAEDVDGNGTVNAQDILAIITLMSASGPGVASSPLPSGSSPFYYDVNADGIVNVFDILGVISYMAAHPPGEGEGQPDPAATEDAASDGSHSAEPLRSRRPEPMRRQPWSR